MKQKTKVIIGIVILVIISILLINYFVPQKVPFAVTEKGYPTRLLLIDEDVANQNLDKLYGFEANLLVIGSTSDYCRTSPSLIVQGKSYSISAPTKEALIFAGKTEFETMEILTLSKIEDIFDPSFFAKGIFFSINRGCAEDIELRDLKFKMFVECLSNSDCVDVLSLTSGECNKETYECENSRLIGIIPVDYELKQTIIYRTIFSSLLLILFILTIIAILKVLKVFKK